MNAQIIISPTGEKLVVIPEAEYRALLNAAENALDRDAVRRFREAIEAGQEELVPSDVADRLIDGENPVRVWREHRKMSTTALAKASGLSQPYIVQIESGSRTGTTASLAKIAKALGIGIEDLVA